MAMHFALSRISSENDEKKEVKGNERLCCLSTCQTSLSACAHSSTEADFNLAMAEYNLSLLCFVLCLLQSYFQSLPDAVHPVLLLIFDFRNDPDTGLMKKHLAMKLPRYSCKLSFQL